MISNYTELKQAVEDWTHRNDLGPQMDTFAQLSEVMIDNDLRILSMDTIVELTLTDEITSLPDDFLATRLLRETDSGIMLTQITPEQLLTAEPSVGSHIYSIHGNVLDVKPAPTPTEPLDITWSYYKNVDTLVSNATNVVLTSYPTIYLAAMMFNANGFIQDDSEQKKWSDIYHTNIDRANRTAVEGLYQLPTTRVG